MYDKLTQAFLMQKAKQKAEEKKLGIETKEEPVFEFDFNKLRQMRKYYK